jgi:hypothetical protein
MISLAKDLQLETRRAVCETFAAGVIEERDGMIFPRAEFV